METSREVLETNYNSIVEVILLAGSAIIIILMLLLIVAYTILIERKLLASIQRRRGPNYVGFLGLLQPIADAIKLIIKETIIPVAANRIIFVIAPLLALILSLLN
jgi:NADH:ubiquinone oxidoreductase subunit H